MARATVCHGLFLAEDDAPERLFERTAADRDPTRRPAWPGMRAIRATTSSIFAAVISMALGRTSVAASCIGDCS